MRVTGGEARGRSLRRPRSPSIRPTSSRVRKALFDILGQRLQGALFLDAFAGSGAVGVEALGRGAAHVVFLERDRRAVRLIRENLRIGGRAGSSKVIEGDAGRSLGRLAQASSRFSIIFLDPPYDHPSPGQLLAAAAPLLEAGGILVLEHRTSVRVEAPPGVDLRMFRSYRHGDTSLTSFLPPPTPSPSAR